MSMSLLGPQSYKVVLLGEGRVGKTSLVLRFCRDTFVDGQPPTIQASCLERALRLGGEVNLGGQGYCPPVPTHMADVDANVAEAQRAWTAVPEHCPSETESLVWEYVTLALVLACVLSVLGIINHRIVTAFCRNTVLRVSACSHHQDWA